MTLANKPLEELSPEIEKIVDETCANFRADLKRIMREKVQPGSLSYEEQLKLMGNLLAWQRRAIAAEAKLAENAEVEAAIAAKAEPDYEAWRPALDAYLSTVGAGYFPAKPEMSVAEKAIIRGIIAALPLAPAEPVDDAWIEQTVRGIATQRGVTGASNLVSIRSDDYRRDLEAAIRATLARCARWPEPKPEPPVRSTAVPADVVPEWLEDLALQVAHAHPEPEWIDWQGGECPVPVGTDVVIQFPGGGTLSGDAGLFEWGSGAGRVRRYRILGAAS